LLRSPVFEERAMAAEPGFPQVQAATACPICGNRAAWTVGTRDRDGQALTSVLCRQCGHAWTDPLPTPAELAQFYSERYRAEYKSVVEPKPYHILRAARIAAGRVEQLKAHWQKAGARHLDIGAGGGEFSYLARAAGAVITPLEPNRGYAQFAAHQYGLQVQNKVLEDAEFAPASFDSVSLFHVLEHLHDPRATLARIAGWLAPGGVVYIEVPNLLDTVQSPHSRYHRAHIHHFSPPTLAAVLQQAGFRVLREWASDDGGVISAIGTPAAVAAPAFSADHAARAAAVLARHTPLSHALHMGWLPRAIRKLSRRAEEKRTAAAQPSAPAILDHVRAAAAAPDARAGSS
jgi:2-polyprenyl-3-methyl-5-hydroxy-6-metoxy-1,4-benzoquinol methylase